CVFVFKSRSPHTSSYLDWISDVCSSDLDAEVDVRHPLPAELLWDRDPHPSELGHVRVEALVVRRLVLHHSPDEARRALVGKKVRSEARRVGNEWRCGGAACQ